MRVLYLTDSLSDLDGVGRYGVRLLRALEEERPGLEVRVLLGRKHRAMSAEVPRHWKVEVALPPDYFFYMSSWKFWASLQFAERRVARAARDCDLVHAIKDYPHNLAGLLGAERAGKPCIATGHGTYTVQPLVDPRHARRSAAAYARFDALIAVSRFTAERVRELLPAQHALLPRLRVIPNAVDAAHYARPASVSRKPWHGLRFTLSIGELKERKGHHLALEAWCAVAATRTDLHHFVVGRGAGDEYERELHARVERAGLGRRVTFLGNVTEEEKVDLLQRAQVFLHVPVTARDGGFEGFGIVYLEASAAKVPCIGTLGCGAEDAIVDGGTGFLVAQEPTAVAEALARVLDDDALRVRLGAGGRAHAAQSSWAANARSVLGLYDEALARRGGSA
ncbi:MAG: glycosyltransferase family 4 protein [Planctomycetes bacterium]|nr:glycosyltransferase family 4 protein [Planctomycetota bacterium]